jgi:hypothetical protein
VRSNVKVKASVAFDILPHNSVAMEVLRSALCCLYACSLGGMSIVLSLGWVTVLHFLAGAMVVCFSPRHRVQTGSGALPASYIIRTGGSCSGGKSANA